MVQRTYDDAALASAVAAARSWRGVLRHLGVAATNAPALRAVRRQVEALDLDHSHFTGQRRWTEAQLADAVAGCGTWKAVAEQLGLSGGGSQALLKGHALRLGLHTSHLGQHRTAADKPPVICAGPDLAGLPRAGPMLAAAWFSLCGYEVCWPLEPCRYDLLVRRSDESLRVQVKTTRCRGATGWTVTVSSCQGSRVTYDPDDIDAYFVVDADGGHYLIPVAAVGGRFSITLSGYEDYRVPAWPSLEDGGLATPPNT